MIRYGWMVAAMLVLAGCKSDEERLRQLELEAARARLNHLRIERIIEDLSAEDERMGVYRDSLDTARREVLLSERAVRRFLR